MSQSPPSATPDTTRPPFDELLARRFWLGSLSATEADRVCASYLRHDDDADLLEALRDELIEDYLDGLLPPAEAVLFTRHFLRHPDHPDQEHPYHAQLVADKRRWRGLLAERAPRLPRAWWLARAWQRLAEAGAAPALAALLAALTIGGGLWWFRPHTAPALVAATATPTPFLPWSPVLPETPPLRPRATPPLLPLPPARPTPPALTPPTTPPPPPPPPPVMSGSAAARVYARPGAMGGATGGTLRLAAGAERAIIEFNAPPAARAGYDLALHDEERGMERPLGHYARLQSGAGGRVAIKVSAGLLRGKRYSLRVRSTQQGFNAQVLYFTVIHK